MAEQPNTETRTLVLDADTSALVTTATGGITLLLPSRAVSGVSYLNELVLLCVFDRLVNRSGWAEDFLRSQGVSLPTAAHQNAPSSASTH